MNRKVVRGLVNFFGCIGLVLTIIGFVFNNPLLTFASTIEVLTCVTVRHFARDE